MAGVFSTAAINQMLEALDETPITNPAGAGFLSLHTAYSSTGTNEVSGGSPAYARKAAVWNAAASAQKALNAAVTFDVPATTVRWVGMWTAVTAGTFLGMVPNGGGACKAFALDDALTDVVKCTAHGFANGDQVVLWDGTDTLPTTSSVGTIYFVITSTTNTFQLSLTSGGAAIDFTVAGSGSVQKIVPEVFAAQGTHQVSSMTLDGRLM